jgi:hypothetical protein
MHIRVVVLLALLAAAALPVAGQNGARADADRADQKFQSIYARALVTPVPPQALKTTITEQELNAYLRLDPHGELPIGVKQPTVVLLDAGRFDARALVDLDAVRTAEKRGWLDPLAYVTGLLEVRTLGVFRGTAGKGVFTLESASIGGAPVPRKLLQELLYYYTRTPEMPNGVQFDTPFTLPAGIRIVELRRGAATVTQ